MKLYNLLGLAHILKYLVDIEQFFYLKKGYIEEAKHWRYSSARDNKDVVGLLKVERLRQVEVYYAIILSIQQ